MPLSLVMVLPLCVMVVWASSTASRSIAGNNLATTSGVTQCLAGVKDFAGFASQFIKHESLTLEKHFGMGHRGLQVYGYKVLKPDAGVLLAAKRS